MTTAAFMACSVHAVGTALARVQPPDAGRLGVGPLDPKSGALVLCPAAAPTGTLDTVTADRAPFPRPASALLSTALAAVSVASCTLLLFVPQVLKGPAAMNGSARGTALVALVVAVPALAAAVVLVRRGSVRWIPIWTGAVAYLLYNAVLFLLATPFNDLFLLFVAMMSLALWTLIAILREVDVREFGRRFPSSTPVDSVAVFVWVIVGLNSLAWIAPVLRAMASDGPAPFLAGTGLTTSPLYVEDLVFWLPAMALGALWLRRRSGWGFLVVTSGLVLWVVESLGVAVDQWVGHAADPASVAVSASMTPVFAIVAGACLVPLLALLWRLPAAPSAGPVTVPSGARRWTLVSLLFFVGAMAVFGGVRMIGDGFGMPTSWLSGTGFASWTLPGTALLVGVAVPQLVVAVAVARSSRWTLPLSWVAGTALVLWVIVQLALLQKFFFLQPVIAALGIAEVLLVATSARA